MTDENKENKENVDFINEKISIGDCMKNLPPITETDFTKDLDYQQNEFKPTLFRYIRLMNKENKDKNGNIIVPDFSYDTTKFSKFSYKYTNNNNNKNEQETIRRIQKTKLSSDLYPFCELVPSHKKKDGSEKKNEKKSKKDETNLKNDDKNKKKVLNISQKRHFNVQNFSIIILCLIINAFCCIIYYTNDWPDVVKRLPNQIELSKIIINNSFVFTGDILFLQKDNNLSTTDHHIIIKNLDYGNIHIDASHIDSRVRCNTMRSNGDTLTIGFINFTRLSDQDAIQMSASNNFDTISINMDVNNIKLLNLKNAKSIFGKEGDSHAFLLDTQQTDFKKENEKKTLLRRSINSYQDNKVLYDKNYNELYFSKLFEIKKDALYISLFENGTLSLLHVVSPLSLNERPKISLSSDLNINNNFVMNCSTMISEKVKAADVSINDKIIYSSKKEVKFVYISNDDFHLHIGKFYFNEAKFSKLLDYDLPKINLNHIYSNHKEMEIKINLSIDPKGFPIITLNENTVINCRHPLCMFDQYP